MGMKRWMHKPGLSFRGGSRNTTSCSRLVDERIYTWMKDASLHFLMESGKDFVKPNPLTSGEQQKTSSSSYSVQAFPRHQRHPVTSHLKSNTVQALARIFSICVGEFNSSSSSYAVSVPPQQNGHIPEHTSEREPESAALLPEYDTQLPNSTEICGIQVEIFSPQRNIANESEHMEEMKENWEICPNPSVLPIDEDSAVVSIVPPLENQHDEHTQEKLVEDSVSKSLEIRDSEVLNCTTSNTNSVESTQKKMVEDPVSKSLEIRSTEVLDYTTSNMDSIEGTQEKLVEDPISKSLEISGTVVLDYPTSNMDSVEGTQESNLRSKIVMVEEEGHETQQMDTEILVDSSTIPMKDKEREEGEIPGDLAISDPSDDLILEHPIELDKHKLEVVGGASKFEVGAEKKESKEAKRVDTRSVVCYDDLDYDKVGTENQGKTSNVKGDKMGNKRKRTLTDERKKKKKLKERKKRAEKDRQAGVKRLKLPISKPKPVKYCNFFLNGRCQQGDLCKFSHDTIPLTKSQPCRFLAKQSCLKGDDCPYDHQLSKYPCDNYQSKGFCNRGDKCMFSHKVVASSPASTASGTISEASTLLHSANAGRQLSKGNTSYKTPPRRAPASLSSMGTSNTKHTGENVAETRMKPPAQAPKGISFLSLGKVQSDNCNKQPQNGTLSVRDNGAEMIFKPPVREPKGVSFLSIGKVPSDNSNKQQNNRSPDARDNDVEMYRMMNQDASQKFHGSNEITRRMPASPRSPCQTSKMIADDKNKDMCNSAQKALSSTLAFASKFESEMGRSPRFPALSIEPDKGLKSNIGSNSKESMTATKILQDFLFGGGNSK